MYVWFWIAVLVVSETCVWLLYPRWGWTVTVASALVNFIAGYSIFSYYYKARRRKSGNN